ncbi:VWA domain-containing protein [Ferrimonas lipolytica]|uniref:VWA domain-containing protein n=1 Tax=Ferrimonas lipolytica TaxID=2724191 RepID=A0A6H1UBU8_9GAMM|nr:VWA domain-containing protein [Ferrimonas lipolytica]QIZ76535.1 VWA domain-containing protein [Ferrimonas lipolytica]
MIELSHPWALLLLPLPYLVYRYATPFKQRRDAVFVPFFNQLAQISGQQPTTGAAIIAKSGFEWVWLILGWLALCLTLAKPMLVGEPIEQRQPAREILVAVDLSRSMYEEDFVDSNNDTINRLEGVKQMMAEFAANRQHDRLGLILFADKPYLQAPFTDNIDTWLTLLQDSQLGMAGSMTAIGDTIGLAVKVFEQGETKQRVLILITDGKDNASTMPPVEAAQVAASYGIKIHTIAIGNPKGPRHSLPDFEQLTAIATRTGGADFRAADRNQLLAINNQLNRLEKTAYDTQSYRPRQTLHHWPLSIWLGCWLTAVFIRHSYGRLLGQSQ